MDVKEIAQIKLQLLELALRIFTTTPHQYNSIEEIYTDLKNEILGN